MGFGAERRAVESIVACVSVLPRMLALLVAVTVAGTTLPALTTTSVADSTGSTPAVQAGSARAAAKPLHGLVIALDPGHQLGNSRHTREINRPVQAGGFTKPCNTTGAATNSGVPEATVNFRLSQAVKRRLEALGARVRMTRVTNSVTKWGPCVDARGRFGKRVGARLMVSLHADGAPSSDHGFHVIAPTRRKPWTTDIATASLRLAKVLRTSLTRGGVPRSNYIGGGSGLDVRSDLGTLNMSDVPVAMIEIGNMRNATDARRMTSAQGRARYAAAVVRGIRTYLRR
jgi:N-acetylmuramoyl-L-alanine amidase